MTDGTQPSQRSARASVSVSAIAYGIGLRREDAPAAHELLL